MFRKILNAINVFLIRWFGGEPAAADPEEAIARERERLAEQVAQFNMEMAKHLNYREKISDHVRSLEAKESALVASVKEMLAAGKRNDAGNKVLALEEVRGELSKYRPKLERAENVCRSLSENKKKLFEQAGQKLQQLSLNVVEMRQTESEGTLRQAMAEEKLARDSRLALLEEEADEAVARHKVAMDMGEIIPPTTANSAESALARFEKEENA
ncbi:MAG: hypothetical protein JXR97_01780 [Planctomycetes bacterium]|nr:hypothetical protein [Planctomycetota bacterium]